MVLSRATPEELAAIYRFATREPLESAECGVRCAELKRGRADGSSTAGAKGARAYVFRWTGRHWEVILACGRAFRLRNTLGARYLDCLQLRSGSPEEQAFAEHLRTHLSIGFECLYTQPQGRIWG